MSSRIVQLGNGSWSIESESGELSGMYPSSLAASRQLSRVTGYMIGLCIPGCLYDAVFGPWDTEAEALDNIDAAIDEYGNPAYVADVFLVDMTESDFDEFRMSF